MTAAFLITLSWLIAASAALWWQYRANGQREAEQKAETAMWRERHDTLRAEADKMYHASADVSFRTIGGRPVFTPVPRMDDEGPENFMGSERAEYERYQRNLTTPEPNTDPELPPEDLEHLEKLNQTVGQQIQ